MRAIESLDHRIVSLCDSLDRLREHDEVMNDILRLIAECQFLMETEKDRYPAQIKAVRRTLSELVAAWVAERTARLNRSAESVHELTNGGPEADTLILVIWSPRERWMKIQEGFDEPVIECPILGFRWSPPLLHPFPGSFQPRELFQAGRAHVPE